MVLGKRIYLDFASGTPIDGEILNLVRKLEKQIWQNPSALHFEGQYVRELLENSRKKIAELLHAKPEEIIFTSGGTEANNLAIRGVVDYYAKKIVGTPEILTSRLEHPSIIESANKVAKVNFVNLNKFGQVDLEDLYKKLNDQTLLVSFATANGELGTVENLKEIKNEIDKWKASQGKSKYDPPFFHTDASQAAICLNVSFDFSNADLITLDGSKIYGPKGTGCLAKKRYVQMNPLLLGGKQEGGLRAGTENVSANYGFALAFAKSVANIDDNYIKFRELSRQFVEMLLKKLPEVRENIPASKRIPNIISICIPRINSEYASVVLDEAGLSCSYSTACASLSESLGSSATSSLLGEECGTSSLRFSLGLSTTLADLKKAVKIVHKSKDNLKLSPAVKISQK